MTFSHRRTFMDRVNAKVQRTEAGCWEWTGYRTPAGYGHVAIGTRAHLAHRAVYEALVGPIPDGLTIDHLCRNRACVNPEHLEPVTQAENTRRGDYSNNGAHLRARTHCPQGHPYDEANTYRSGGARSCRTCQLARMNARNAAARAQRVSA